MITDHQAATLAAQRYFRKPPQDDYIRIGVDAFGAPIKALACLVQQPQWPWRKIFLDNEEKKIPAMQHTRTGEVRYFEHEFTVEVLVRPTTLAELQKVQALDGSFPKVIPSVPPAQRQPDRRERLKQSSGRLRVVGGRGWSEDPILQLSKEDREAKIEQYGYLALAMCTEADWHNDLEIAGPKIIDQLMYMCERLIFNVDERMAQLGREANRLQREAMGDEIPTEQLNRIEKQQLGMHVQKRHYQLMAYAFRLQRDHVVARSGIESWGQYEGLKQRFERSAMAWRSKRTQRRASVEALQGMSEIQYRQWLESTAAYEPRHDGVDAEDVGPLHLPREDQE